MKNLTILFLSCISLCSCGDNGEFKKMVTQRVWEADSLDETHVEQITWKDSLGFTHWKTIEKKSPVFLKFTDKFAILEIPKLKNTMAVAPLLHKRNSGIKDTSSFAFEYEMNEKDSIITLNIDFLTNINLKYRKSKLYWPLRSSLKYDPITKKIKDTTIFQSK